MRRRVYFIVVFVGKVANLKVWRQKVSKYGQASEYERVLHKAKQKCDKKMSMEKFYRKHDVQLRERIEMNFG